jgi:hypothetical protein
MSVRALKRPVPSSLPHGKKTLPPLGFKPSLPEGRVMFPAFAGWQEEWKSYGQDSLELEIIKAAIEIDRSENEDQRRARIDHAARLIASVLRLHAFGAD